MDEIRSDKNWNLMDEEGEPSEYSKTLNRGSEFLFAFNYTLDKCEILLGNYNPNYCHPGGGIPNYATWVGGTMHDREEIPMNEIFSWIEEPESVIAYFPFEKGTAKLRDFIKLNERFYAGPDFGEGDSVYQVELVLYYHILPSEVETMKTNGFVDIAGGIASDAGFKFVFEKIDI